MDVRAPGVPVLAPAPHPPPGGRIGPNAVTRTAEVLERALGRARTAGLFARAGLREALEHPPGDMVREEAVTRLFRTVHEELGGELARNLLREAGRRTGDYLLRRRIPRPARILLRCLPPRPAARLLVAAIGRHSWTFAGSGRFRARGSGPVTLAVSGCPLCRGMHSPHPQCDYYAACFERIFRALVHSRSIVTETTCQASGSDACRFEVAW